MSLRLIFPISKTPDSANTPSEGQKLLCPLLDKTLVVSPRGLVMSKGRKPRCCDRKGALLSFRSPSHRTRREAGARLYRRFSVGLFGGPGPRETFFCSGTRCLTEDGDSCCWHVPTGRPGVTDGEVTGRARRRWGSRRRTGGHTDTCVVQRQSLAGGRRAHGTLTENKHKKNGS